MWQFEQSPRIDLPDVTHVVAQINHHTDFFHSDIPITVNRAPGQLPLMGMPNSEQLLYWLLATATFVAAQPDPEPNLTIWDLRLNETEREPFVTWPIATIMPSEAALDYAEAHTLLTANTHQQWLAYVAGVLVVLQREQGLHFAQGLRLLIASNIPADPRFGATTALTVATMNAVCAVYDLPLDGSEIALLCHRVEHEVVGNSASIARQVTAIYGEQDQLVSFQGKLAESPITLPLPTDLSLWVINVDSHRTDGEMVRIAALMGCHIMADLAPPNPKGIAVDDTLITSWANIQPSEWFTHYQEHLPPMLDGATFRLHYGNTTKSELSVDVERIYPVRRATEHMIYEKHRTQLFQAILQASPHSTDHASLLGELMYQSHISYRACGGVTDEEDDLVTLIRNAGAVVGLYGARVSIDNTVVVLAHRDAEETLHGLIEQHQQETGCNTKLLTGSSPGAMAFEVFWLLYDTIM